jgi:hypothetical protein
MKGFLLALVFAGGLLAQNPPDCFVPPAQIISPGNLQLDNRGTGCNTWTVWYISEVTGFTVTFQSSLGINTPDSFGSYTGSTVASSSSFGTAMVGVATFTGLSATPGASVETPWVNVSVTGGGGAVVRVGLYGYRTGATGGTGGGGGGGGGSGCPNPCPVEGVDSPGVAPTVPPVGVAGFDGTDGRRIKTDAAGDIINSPLPRTTSLSGQQAVTGTAASLGTHTVGGGFCVVADSGNTINVFLGPTGVTTSTGFPLLPGQTACNNLGNTNELFVVASTTGATVEWLGTN